jgi:bifunctional DNase/RNase
VKNTNFKIESVIIYQIKDGVFFSNINFKNPLSDEELILDARTSDAVAMAVRFDAPIFTTNDVLNEAGILLELDETPKMGDEETDSDEVSDFNDLSGISAEELDQLIADAVREEDYDTDRSRVAEDEGENQV